MVCDITLKLRKAKREFEGRRDVHSVGMKDARMKKSFEQEPKNRFQNGISGSLTRNTLGRLFQIRTPSRAKEFRPYLFVLARGITADLSFRREYCDRFSAIRFSIKVGAMLLTILNMSRAISFTLFI